MKRISCAFALINDYNCANFVSQAIAYGFGTGTSFGSYSSFKMYSVSGTYVDGWSASSGGGKQAWENSQALWNFFINRSLTLNGPHGSTRTESSLKAGDVLQVDYKSGVYTGIEGPDGIYDHTAICVDTATKKFAQHSVHGYYYLSTYKTKGNTRIMSPTVFVSGSSGGGTTSIPDGSR